MDAHEQAVAAAAAAGEAPPDRPRVAFGDMAALAQEVIEHHGDDPAADFARLYLMFAHQHFHSDLASADDATAVALQALSQTSDRLVTDNALVMLAFLPPVSHPPSDEHLEALTGHFDDLDDPTVQASVAQYLADAAFARRDWDEADRWLGALADAADALCAEQPGHRGCEPLAREIAASRGQLGVARGRGSDGWRDALIQVVWFCHDATPLRLDDEERNRPMDLQCPRSVVGRHDGIGWAFEGWQPRADDFTACVDREATTLPAPPDPRRELKLDVFRFDPGSMRAWGD